VRALVTGGNGFAGRFLRDELLARGFETTVAGRPRDGGVVDVPLELADIASVRAAVAAAAPDLVFHLAAQAFVPEANRAPLATYDVNILGTARLIEALRESRHGTPPRLLFVSSGDVYGIRSPAEMPLRETLETRPATPYAASKAAGEAIVLASARTYGVPVVVARAFNHIGPCQSERFAVASFAARLAKIAAGAEPILPVGNLAAARDFLDVRDVVRAYVTLALDGRPGEIYNVCSGEPVTVQEILRLLITLARVAVEVREDPALLRPSDAPVTYGDNSKLHAETGWRRGIALGQTLRDLYAAARGAGAEAQ
jgi:GDP-4-dehydro-6-deoxy-D-mannose reductase